MIPYAEFYNYDRLESAAVELGLLNTEADEENLLNLHNQLVWHLYRFDKDPRADAILYAVIEAILGEKAADITDVPWELRCVWEGGNKGGRDGNHRGSEYPIGTDWLLFLAHRAEHTEACRQGKSRAGRTTEGSRCQRADPREE